MSVARDSAGTELGRSLGRRDRTVRAIARAWRELTGGTGRDRDAARRTLIACSGGGDSSGLVLALSAAVSRPRELFVVGHVVHDMRGREESWADRDAARRLAEKLGLKFVEDEVRVRGEKGNAEAVARRLRYAALERMAVEEGCGFVAVGHHAEDQLETMLMALVRGAGPRGMSGMAGRCNAGRVKVIRPALKVTREAMRELCRASGWEWREDATNLDEQRLRAAIRHRVLPELERLRPGAAVRAARSAELMRGAAGVVRRRVVELIGEREGGGELRWKREELRGEAAVVLGDLIRFGAAMLKQGEGKDRMSSSAVGRVARAIRDPSTEEREFSLGGVAVVVTSKFVTIGRKPDG